MLSQLAAKLGSDFAFATGAALIHRSVSVASSDYDGCWVDTYDRNIGTLPSYEACYNSDTHTDLGLTCTEKLGVGGCEWYSPWNCDTYNKNPFCSDSSRAYEDLLCYKNPKYGYECLLTVCETFCPAAMLGSDDCGLFCSKPGGSCVEEILGKIFTAGKFVSTIASIAGLPAAGLAGALKLAATSAAAKLFTDSIGGLTRPADPSDLAGSCNPDPGAVYSRRITRIVPELVEELTSVFSDYAAMAAESNSRPDRDDTMK